ncbi:MAG: hypothetical protein ACK4TA_02495 [Saprospiraceae bacterium]
MNLKSFFSVLFLTVCMVAVTYAQKAESGKALIISTTSKDEVEKIKASLKDADPSTYRLTITTTDKLGKSKVTTLGSAPLEEVNKIKGESKIAGLKGGYAASDIVILIKNITSSGVLRDNVLKQLNTKLSQSATVNLNYQLDKANQLKVSRFGTN